MKTAQTATDLVRTLPAVRRRTTANPEQEILYGKQVALNSLAGERICR